MFARWWDWMLLLLICVLLFAAGSYLLESRLPYVPPEPSDQLLEVVGVEPPMEGERSGSWRRVRDEFVARHPTCIACGSRESLNVHHIKPFHSHPELELEPSNLCVLCREHHFYIGHDPDGPAGPRRPNWKSSNPRVLNDARAYRLQHGGL